MSKKCSDELIQLINDKAKEFGAGLVGIASLDDLKKSPSHTISEKIAEYNGVGTTGTKDRKRGVVKWPKGAKSAIVIAVEHPIDKPEMDWWVSDASGGNTLGNRLLIRTVTEIAAWLENEQRIECFNLPYHIERGGAYMKDAAVLAGLGCIGKNNMLISPQYGPRLRLRVMLTTADLPSAGVQDYDPCENCPAPCRTVCPRNAFEKQIYFEEEYGQEELPGRNGEYSRISCNQKMVENESDSEEVEIDNLGKMGKQVKYCRECERACPIGAE